MFALLFRNLEFLVLHLLIVFAERVSRPRGEPPSEPMRLYRENLALKAQNQALLLELHTLRQRRKLSLPARAAQVFGYPRWIVMRCPCGCGDTLSISVSKSVEPAWRMYKRGDRITLFPSVWRETGCMSHFIVWNDQISWIGGEDDTVKGEDLRQRVLDVLDDHRLISFADIADTLEEVPWDVLSSCRRLVREGKAIEARGADRGRFKRVSHP